jgi:hypothetical protein
MFCLNYQLFDSKNRREHPTWKKSILEVVFFDFNSEICAASSPSIYVSLTPTQPLVHWGPQKIFQQKTKRGQNAKNFQNPQICFNPRGGGGCKGPHYIPGDLHALVAQNNYVYILDLLNKFLSCIIGSL